jgi:hypothetical protein
MVVEIKFNFVIKANGAFGCADTNVVLTKGTL